MGGIPADCGRTGSPHTGPGADREEPSTRHSVGWLSSGCRMRNKHPQYDQTRDDTDGSRKYEPRCGVRTVQCRNGYRDAEDYEYRAADAAAALAGSLAKASSVGAKTVNWPPLSVSTKLTCWFSFPDTAAVNVVNIGLCAAAVATGSCAIPSTDPAPEGTCWAYA